MPFDRVTTWVFDLDETLYPPSAPLFPQIEARMAAWIMRALDVDAAMADRLRARWWHDHGTTLAGPMREHGADPAPFLADVHHIDVSVLASDLTAFLRALRRHRLLRDWPLTACRPTSPAWTEPLTPTS